MLDTLRTHSGVGLNAYQLLVRDHAQVMEFTSNAYEDPVTEYEFSRDQLQTWHEDAFDQESEYNFQLDTYIPQLMVQSRTDTGRAPKLNTLIDTSVMLVHLDLFARSEIEPDRALGDAHLESLKGMFQTECDKTDRPGLAGHEYDTPFTRGMTVDDAFKQADALRLFRAFYMHAL